jgi:hypothetical protein
MKKGQQLLPNFRLAAGIPPVEAKLEAVILQMAQKNSGWGYHRIVGPLANLGYDVSDAHNEILGFKLVKI